MVLAAVSLIWLIVAALEAAPYSNAATRLLFLASIFSRKKLPVRLHLSWLDFTRFVIVRHNFPGDGKYG
ncbi:MAG: hypothetical protein A4E38_01039 [Methanoregulaceae archaeon PtaB.Bin108]|nr:MAG: hypothetical protein A4E38_01039 [Methanoregulaceae archaeon PtaB.Bin108]